MRMLVEREIIEFIIPVGTNKYILLRDSCQYFIEVIVMCKTRK